MARSHDWERIIAAGAVAAVAALGAPAVDHIPPPRAAPRTLQVLSIDGMPRWENRYTRALLDRSGAGLRKAFDHRYVLLGADRATAGQDRRALADLPNRGELDHFDLVIVGDVDPSDPRVGADHLRNIARFVRDGGGLLVLAGPHHSPHDFKGTGLADVLPIELGVRPPAKTDDVRTAGYRPVLTAAGRDHPAVRFDPDPAASRKVWAALPEMYWFADGYTARPGAVVLATHPTVTEKGSPLPLVLWHTVGKGRCAFVGFDESWRWRRNDGLRHHEAFWVGLWRSLAAE